jgi:hypothetical protein
MSNIYTAGLNNVGSYQVSGIPYLTGAFDASSGASVLFPHVTKWIQISNSGSAVLYYSYSENGASTTPGNYGIVFPNESTPVLEVKATELYLNGGTANGAFVAAGLTNLPIERVNNISPSGSNWSGSVGVG